MTTRIDKILQGLHEEVVELAHIGMLQRRLKTLDDRARPNGYTFFEVVFADGCRRQDEEVARFALEHGWSVWVRMGHGAESRKQLETSEIQSIVFSKASNTVLITMKANHAKVQAGEYISSYSVEPGMCGLIPN